MPGYMVPLALRPITRARLPPPPCFKLRFNGLSARSRQRSLGRSPCWRQHDEHGYGRGVLDLGVGLAVFQMLRGAPA